MADAGIDPALLHAWLAGRSIARGLPAPVPDHGGWRVDTGSEAEARRWVFPGVETGLVELARTIAAPRHVLKACATAGRLRETLPAGWRLHAPGYFMEAAAAPAAKRPPAPGYLIATERRGAVSQVRVTTASGEPAAGGYAAETGEAFVYDRIATAPDHRRKGLGTAVMEALRRTKRRSRLPELLVATEEGGALYATLGWLTLSPYSSASIPET